MKSACRMTLWKSMWRNVPRNNSFPWKGKLMEITMKKYMPVDYDFVYQLKKVCYYPYVSEIWGWDEEKQTDYFNAFMENAKENAIHPTVENTAPGICSRSFSFLSGTKV